MITLAESGAGPLAALATVASRQIIKHVAVITDADSNESKSTPGLTFYVQRPSILSPLRKNK